MQPSLGKQFCHTTRPEAAVLPRAVFLERPAKPCVDLLSHIVNPRNRGKLRFSAERKIEFSKRGKNSDFRDPGKSEIPNLALVCSLAFSGVFRSAVFRGNQKKRVFLGEMEYFLRTSKSISGLRVHGRPMRRPLIHVCANHLNARIRPCVHLDPHAGCPNAAFSPFTFVRKMMFCCICKKALVRAQLACNVGVNLQKLWSVGTVMQVASTMQAVHSKDSSPSAFPRARTATHFV